jgi:hypothetical protein
MGKKIIIIQNQHKYRKVYEEDIQKVFYLTPKIIPKIPCFKFKARKADSNVSTDN